MAEEKGHLTNEKLEGVLKDLAAQKFTGCLSVWDESSWKEFFFAGTGARVTSVGARKTLPLGEYLVRRGFLEREVLDKALEAQVSSMNMLGEILVEKEELEPQHRDKALRWQAEEELADLWNWPRPHYEYRPGPQTQVYSIVAKKRSETNTKSLSITVPAADLIRSAREIFKEMSEVRGTLRFHSVYRLTELGRQKIFVKGGFKALSDPEQRIVVLVDGRRTLEEIQAKAMVVPDDALRITFKLLKYGALKEE